MRAIYPSLEPSHHFKPARAHGRRLQQASGTIVPGCFNPVCLPLQSRALHAAWPVARLKITRDAEDFASAPGVVGVPVIATDVLAQRLA